MRIAVVGAHGTGKTTLVKTLADELNLHIIPDTAAEAFHKGFTVNENTPVENQFWILCKQLEYERAAGGGFIADKALYDNIVYSRNIFSDPSVLSIIEDIVLKNAQYDLLFYVPIEFALEDDGRSMDVAFQKKIDTEYKELLALHKLQHITLSGTVQQRVERAVQAIRQHAKTSTRRQSAHKQ